MAQTSIVPALVSGLINESFKSRLNFGVAFQAPVDDEIRNKGDRISINGISKPTISDYTKGDTLTFEDLDTTATTLLVDFSKSFAFKWDNQTEVQSAPKGLIDSSTRDAGYELADEWDIYLATELSNGSIVSGLGTSSVPLAVDSSTILNTLALMYQRLTEAAVPTENRYCIIPPWAYTKLVLAGVFNATENAEPLINGYVSRLMGFDIFVSPNCLKSGTAWSQFYAGTPQCGAQATQIFNVKMGDIPNEFSTYVKGLQLGGAKLWKPEGVAVAHCVETAES